MQVCGNCHGHPAEFQEIVSRDERALPPNLGGKRAPAIGWGGILRVARATGIARNTIAAGLLGLRGSLGTIKMGAGSGVRRAIRSKC